MKRASGDTKGAAGGRSPPQCPGYGVAIVETCDAVTLMSNARVFPEFVSRRTQFKVTVTGFGNTFAITNGSVTAPGMELLCAGPIMTVLLSESMVLPPASCARRLHRTYCVLLVWVFESHVLAFMRYVPLLKFTLVNVTLAPLFGIEAVPCATAER